MRKGKESEVPALLIIDMVRDNFDEAKRLPITPLARETIPAINRTIRHFRQCGWPIVFATDAYHLEDFIFKGRMGPHSLAGTPGAEVMDELERRETDYWLPKPRFSAFFATGLENWLREHEVTLCAVGGVATPFCVLTSALDALCHGFKAVLLGGLLGGAHAGHARADAQYLSPEPALSPAAGSGFGQLSRGIGRLGRENDPEQIELAAGLVIEHGNRLRTGVRIKDQGLRIND